MNDLIVRSGEMFVLDPDTASRIAFFERKTKEIKAKEDEIKALILSEMERKGIIKIDTEDITITRVLETTRESFDTKKFKVDYPLMYDEYCYQSPVKSSVRIKLKE